MISWGFSFGYSDYATLDEFFPKPSCYIYIAGILGDVVYENSNGQAQWLPGVLSAGIYPVAARRILSTGVVNGTSRTTTATNIVYCSTNIP